MNKGFNRPLTNTHKVVSTKKVGNPGSIPWNNTGKTNIPFKSSTPGATNPTTDADDKTN